MATATLKKLYLSLLIVLVAFGCGAVFWLFSGKPRLPPEFEDLKVRYDQVKPEMTEEQVDVLFTGYGSSKEEFATDRDSNDKPLISVSSFVRIYDKPGGIEGDRFVRVYFDYFGCVVGKYIGSYDR